MVVPILMFCLGAVLPSPISAVERLLQAHGWTAPARDRALDEAAAELAVRVAGPIDGPDPQGASELLRFVLAEHGISDAHVYPFTVRYRASEGLERELPGLLGRLERRLPPTHYGLATHGLGSTLTTTLLLVHRGAVLDAPLPREAEPGTLLPVSGALRRGYFKPRVLVAPPDGQRVRERPAWTPERRLDVTLYFDAGPGEYGVEIVADSQYGPVVLHNHRVFVGVPAPTLPVVRLSPGGPVVEGDPARAVYRLIDALRAERGLPTLEWSKALAEAAQAHAAEMARRRTLAHGSPDSGVLTTRLRAHGIDATDVAENLAEATDPAAALQAFLDSPGHMRNLLLPRLTHIGVGVVGRYFAVAMAELPEE